MSIQEQHYWEKRDCSPMCNHMEECAKCHNPNCIKYKKHSRLHGYTCLCGSDKWVPVFRGLTPNPNFKPQAYAPGAALRFLEAAPHLETCTWSNLFTCNCGYAEAKDEIETMMKKVEAQYRVIEALEFVEETGECAYGCGGDSVDGHEVGCQYIELLVDNGLLEIETEAE